MEFWTLTSFPADNSSQWKVPGDIKGANLLNISKSWALHDLVLSFHTAEFPRLTRIHPSGSLVNTPWGRNAPFASSALLLRIPPWWTLGGAAPPWTLGPRLEERALFLVPRSRAETGWHFHKEHLWKCGRGWGNKQGKCKNASKIPVSFGSSEFQSKWLRALPRLNSLGCLWAGQGSVGASPFPVSTWPESAVSHAAGRFVRLPRTVIKRLFL